MPAQLEKPVLPPHLYRYRKLRNDVDLQREIEAIRDKALWFADYHKLNDPMEGLFEPGSRLLKNTAYSKIARRILNAKQNIGICCFSDTYDSELMWTHYASDYQGICVGYRVLQFIAGLPDHVRLVRLAYDTKPPLLSEADGNDITSTAIKILSHKKANWFYEREWRLLANQEVVTFTTKRPQASDSRRLWAHQRLEFRR